MMTAEPPMLNESGRYPIGEAAKLLGISRQTLLRKLRQRLIKCSFQRSTRRKIFTGKQLMQLWLAEA